MTLKPVLYWSAVRAMTRVATPQDEARWVEYARTHLVREVEQRVATARAGEDPHEPRWGGSPTLLVRRAAERSASAER